MMFLLGNIDCYLVGMGNSCKKGDVCLKMDSEALFNAITNRDFHLVKLFATRNVQGMDYDYRDSKSGETLLTRAVDVGNEAIVQFLLKKGASVDTPNHSGYTSIMKAVINNQPNILESLLSLQDREKPCLDARSGHGETALMLACARHYFFLMVLLLNAGADPAIENSKGLKAVDYIIIFDSDDIYNKKFALEAIDLLKTIQSK